MIHAAAFGPFLKNLEFPVIAFRLVEASWSCFRVAIFTGEFL